MGLTRFLVDPTLIPDYDLPLQATLYFTPPPTPLATSYLQRLAETSGVQDIPRHIFETTYNRTRYRLGIDAPDCPTHPVPSDEESEGGDLRKAIWQTQMMCHSGHGPAGDSLESLAVEKTHAGEILEALGDWSTGELFGMPSGEGVSAMNELARFRDLERFTNSVSLANCLERRALDELEVRIEPHFIV